MTFLAPVMFWIAAGVVPALVLLYFLKLRRQAHIVPSTLLWRKAIQDLQVNAPFQRLRRNILLLLQLLVLAAGVFALARPIIRSTASLEERVVILIDCSASMNAVEPNGKTRLELAKEQATRLTRTLNQSGSDWFQFLGVRRQTQAMAIAFSDRASVISPFTANMDDLARLIREIPPTDARTDLAEAMQLAEAYMAPPTMTTDQTPVSTETPSKLVLLSDGRIGGLKDLAVKHGTMEWIRVGESRDNAGITALRTQRNFDTPALLNVYVQISNFAAEPITTDVALYVDGVLADARVHTVELEGAPTAPNSAENQAAGATGGGAQGGPGATPLPAAALGPTKPADAASGPEGSSTSLSFELTLDRGALLEARLSRGDALMQDNAAFAVVPPPRKFTVLTVSKRNALLDLVLSTLRLDAYPFVTPVDYEARRRDFETDGQSRFDVVIFDRYTPKSLPAGNFVFLDAAPPDGDIKLGDEHERHYLIWWDEWHPILRNVALESVFVHRSRPVAAPKDAEILIEAAHGPLLARYSAGPRQYVVLGFSLDNSEWWRDATFPTFIANLLRFLAGGSGEREVAAVRPGETLRVQLPEKSGDITLRRPDESTIRLVGPPGGAVYYGGTSRVGVYKATPGIDGQDTYAVNLEDPDESAIAPHAGELLMGGTPIKQGEAIRAATPEVWRWFVGAALAIVLLEWYIYNRRVMI